LNHLLLTPNLQIRLEDSKTVGLELHKGFHPHISRAESPLPIPRLSTSLPLASAPQRGRVWWASTGRRDHSDKVRSAESAVRCYRTALITALCHYGRDASAHHSGAADSARYRLPRGTAPRRCSSRLKVVASAPPKLTKIRRPPFPRRRGEHRAPRRLLERVRRLWALGAAQWRRGRWRVSFSRGGESRDPGCVDGERAPSWLVVKYEARFDFINGSTAVNRLTKPTSKRAT
jgi:hypothetical protein